tara:strand:- start:188 stop:1177 length:990 start_codon:yes stop_codon:yes gene_type:complete
MTIFRHHCTKTTIILLFTFCVHADAQTPPLQVTPPTVSTAGTNHSIWYISTRHLPLNPEENTNGGELYYYRLTNNQWQPSTFKDYSADTRPTCLIVHGSPASTELVANASLEVYEHLASQIKNEQSVRFVIWSWPAHRRVTGLVNEFKDQVIRAEQQSRYLAQFIDATRNQSPTAVVGYSMGGRVMLGALELLAGGKPPHQAKYNPSSTREQPFKVMLLVSAVGHSSLQKGALYSSALTQADECLVIYNNKDPLLKRYRKLFDSKREDRQYAIGHIGAQNPTEIAASGVQYLQLDVTASIGNHHDIRAYTRNKTVLRQIIEHSLMSIID